MQKLLGPMIDRVRAFVEGHEDLVLVVESPVSDAPPILNILEQVETTSSSDLFWTFTDPFRDAHSYVEAVVDGFATRHAAIREALEQDEDMASWPAIPAEVLSSEAPPADRLRSLAAYSRRLLPIPLGGTNVWVFYPLELSGSSEFAGLMSALTEHDFPFPWCHHLRFIVRFDPASDAAGAVMRGRPRVDWWRPDLSQEAINRALEDEVDDESAPLERRMGSLLMLAGGDFALHRYDLALEKYGLLLRYHGSTGNLPMAAIALNGMGESFDRLGQVEQAERAYHAAMIPASDGDPPSIPILLNIVMNLADLRQRQRRWAEAEGYWDSAQQLAAAARNAPLRIQALEQRGVCQEAQGKLGPAEKSWDAGCIMAAKTEEQELCASLLQRLQGLYQRTGRNREAHGAAQMLDALRG